MSIFYFFYKNPIKIRNIIQYKKPWYSRLYFFQWSGRQDLNLQPLGPKPNALPSWATSRYGALEGIRTPDLLVRSQTLYPTELRAQAKTSGWTTIINKKMVAPAGIEPATQGFSVPCSTDWAMKPNNGGSYGTRTRDLLRDRQTC